MAWFNACDRCFIKTKYGYHYSSVTGDTITVDVLQYGAQAPYEEDDFSTNSTSSQWVALKAWADYLRIDLTKGGINDTLQYYSDYESVNTWTKYEEYYCQDQISKLPNGGHYVIESGKTAWLLGDEMLTLTNESRWSPMNLVLRIRTEGTVTVSIAAFRNKNNVYTPLSPELKYNKDTQRTYPEGVSGADKESDLDGKSKGLSNSVAEVEAVTSWIIDDLTEYFTPTVYNMANPSGFTIAKNGHANYWVTNYNVNQDSSNTNNGTESEMLPLEFSDSTRTWIFDTRHYTPMNGNGPISGTPPISNAVIMGNYGVTQRYIINISNITEFDKNIVYQLGTKSHAIIRYKLDSMQSWNTIVKCNTINDSYNTQNEIFEVMIPALSKDRLVFEVMLPNADNGGFQNSLKVK